jgi:hypothetical protein
MIVTHGWPGSIIEHMKIIEPLTNPTAHGGRGRTRTSNQRVMGLSAFALEKPPKPMAIAGDAPRISPF